MDMVHHPDTGKKELSQRVKEIGPWHYSHRLPHGIVTGQPPGDQLLGKMRRLIRAGAFPKPVYRRVLDLGANSGLIAMWFADKKRSRVVAIEAGPKYYPQLELAVQVKGYGKRIECRNQNIYEADFGKSRFDLILFLGTLHHLKSEAHLGVLRGCWVALSFGGELVLQTKTTIPGARLLVQAGFRGVRKLYDAPPSIGRSAWKGRK